MINLQLSNNAMAVIKRTSLILSLVIIVMGAFVMVGWAMRYSPLVQINSAFAPMQFNTALCFFLCGIGLCLTTLNLWPVLSKILVGIVVAISALTFSEYLFEIDFKIDNLFTDPFVTTKTTHPGRMAPNTALCFIVLSLALLIRGYKHQRVLFFSASLSLIVFVILSFIAYGLSDGSLYGLGTFTRMAIHTTFGFLFAAISLFLIVLNLKHHTKINKWDVLPVISFVMLSLLSFFAWNATKEAEQDQSRQYFLQQVFDTQSVISERFSLYKQSLLGGLGLFNASDNVTLAEWRKYVDALNLDENLPGINGVGYIDYVLESELGNYLKTHRQESYADYKNHPRTDFSDKFIIRYSEPISANLPAIGLDIGFEKNRREAAENARDIAKPVLTRKITLVQDDVKRSGFLFLVPRYKSDVIPKTLAERQDTLLGWVYAPFIADKFLKGVNDKSNGQIGFTIYDGKVTDDAHLIYDGQDHGLDNSSLFEHTTEFFAAERIWTIKWYTTSQFIEERAGSLHIFVFLIGFLMTFLITSTLFLLARINGQSAQELVDSRNQLDAVVQGAVDGLITIDSNGTILTFNKACESIFDYKANDIIGKNISVFIPEHFLDDYKKYIQNSKNTIPQEVFGKIHQLSALRKNGTEFPIDLSISLIPINDGVIYSGIIRDITDRQAAEDEIIRSNEELEYFAYIASHDLQEPLRMISNFTGLLDEEYKDKLDGDAAQYMEFILDGSKRMQALVSDLLEYSRVNSDDAGAEIFDANDQMSVVLQNLKEQGEQTKSKITYDPLPIRLNANPIRFSRLLQNLVGNAIKYRHADRTPNIHVSCKEQTHDWLFSVKDNGIGMKSEYLEQIFVIFKRLHGKSAYSGTGIGLSVCKKIVENMGGKIWVESELGEGSTFYFTLPKKRTYLA